MDEFIKFIDSCKSYVELNMFISKLPPFLKTPDKKNYLNKIAVKIYRNENITKVISKNDIPDFLKYQPRGQNYQIFDYFIKTFNLKLDNNGMIIFTKKFPFDNTICKEAILIWWILKLCNSNNFINKHNEYLTYETQSRLEKNLFQLNENKRIDLCFTKLLISVEIDEYHHNDNQYKDNDNIKQAICRLNGFRNINLIFSKIVNKHTFNKSDNINSIILNNEYLTKFKNYFIDAINCSLVRFEKPRKEYIMNLFKQNLTKRVKEFVKELILEKKYIIKFKKLKLKEEIIRLKESYNCSLEIYKEKKSILDDLNNGQVFKLLFELKNKSHKGIKIINFQNLLDLFNIGNDDKNLDEIKSLKKFLRELKFIKYNYKSDNDILINWKELSEVISNFIDVKPSYKNMLEEYYRGLESSYEEVITMIDKHNNLSKSSLTDFNQYAVYIDNKNINNNKIKKLQNTINDLEKVHLNDIKEIKKLQNTINDLEKVHLNDVKEIDDFYVSNLDYDSDDLNLDDDLELDLDDDLELDLDDDLELDSNNNKNNYNHNDIEDNDELDDELDL